VTNETKILSEEFLNTLIPNHLGKKSKIWAGFVRISKNTIKHRIIEDFLLHQPLLERFTVDDVKKRLDELYPERNFFRDTLKTSLWGLTHVVFPHRMSCQTNNGRKGRQTEYFLTSRIKKIYYYGDE
jgi:hypothetical protein